MDISRLRMGKKWSIWGPLIPYSPKCCEKVCTRYFLKKISISCPEISLKNIVQQINPCWEVGVLLILLILLCCFVYVWGVHLILCWSFELGGYLHLLSMVLSILCPGKVSVGVDIGWSAAVWGWKQQQLQDVLCLSMERWRLLAMDIKTVMLKVHC